VHNFGSVLWRVADRRPDHPAVVDGQVTSTYRQLRERAGAYAALLVDADVAPGDRVALLFRRTADAAAALFGAWAAGAVAVVVADVLRPRQVAHVVDHSGAAVLIVGPGVAIDAPTCPARRLDPPGEAEAGTGTGATLEAVPRAADDLAQLTYTSGSTGLPKGVMVTHANLHAGVAAVREYLGITADDRLAGLLPFSFDYGLNQLLVAVASEATLVVDRSPVAARVDGNLRTAGVTVVAGVPTLWRQLLQVERFRSEPVPTLRLLTSTGGRLGEDTVRQLRGAQPQAALFSMYGLTEAFRSTFLPPSQVDRKPRSVGRAIPGADVAVVRPDGSACAPFEVGEITHRGPTLTLGYWRDEATTRKVFRPLTPGDPEVAVWSGDYGHLDADGDLYVEGRRDRQLKRLGFRVSPDEVVDGLLSSRLVADASVTSVAATEERPEPEIVGHVVLEPGADLGEVERHLATELPRHLRPDRLVAHEALPTTPHGKPDVAALERAAR
jgi:acyl-CoA synthetase (AMP-forming)/AMP-acid ligase II